MPPPRVRDAVRRALARLDLAQTVNERYTFALRSASPKVMLHLTDQGTRGRDAAQIAASRVWELMSGFPSPERQARLMMVLQACLDDSGELDQTINPVFVLAGFIAESESWASFSHDWRTALDAPPSINYFKMAEAANLRDQFGGLCREQANAKIHHLVAVIKKYTGMRISISVDKLAFFKYIRSMEYPVRNNNVDKPYCLAFQWILLEVPKMQLLHSFYFGSKPRPVDFIFDEQGEIGLEAQGTWLFIKRLAERLAQAGKTDFRPCLGAMPKFENEKNFLPLQASDLYAWHLRRFFYNNRRLILPPNSVLKEILSIPALHTHLGEAELKELRLGALPQRPIGVDLVGYIGSKAEQKQNRIKLKASLRAASKARPKE